MTITITLGVITSILFTIGICLLLFSKDDNAITDGIGLVLLILSFILELVL